MESRFVDTLSFSGVVDYVGDVTVKIDDKVITHVTSDSDGVYGGILHVSDTLGVGFHDVSIEYDGISESAEFLIAANDAITLSEDITISRDKILEAGGAITISVSGIMNDFVPSTVQPLFINVSGVESQEFSIMPKMYGYYLQNFVIGDKIGEYDVSVSYEGDTIESYSISVVPAESSWVKSHTELWLDGIMSDESYLKKAVLLLDGYEVSPGVTSPEWFVESAGMWVDGTMSDESFYDAIMFLAENGLL